MQFDVEGAHGAGYTYAEIADYLGGHYGYDVAGARNAGIPDAQLASYLSRQGALYSELAESKQAGRAIEDEMAMLEAYESDPDVPLPMRYELGRQVAKGLAGMASGIAGAGAMLTPGALSRSLLEAGQSMEEMADIPTGAPKSIGEIESVGDFAGFAGSMLAQQIPQLLLGAAAGGGLAARGISPARAAMLGPAITTFPQEAGSIYSDIVRQTGETGPAQRAVALGGGLASAALESVGGESRLFRNLLQPGMGGSFPRMAGRAAAEAAKSAGAEAITEGAQEAIGALAPAVAGGRLPSVGEFAERVGTGALGGLLVGGAMGGAGQLVGDVRQRAVDARIDDIVGQLGRTQADFGRVGANRLVEQQPPALLDQQPLFQPAPAPPLIPTDQFEGRAPITPELQIAQPSAQGPASQIGRISSYGVMPGDSPSENRVFVSVPVNGFPMLFYKSSKGTSGKRAGGWYPAFGLGVGDWIVKGSVQNMEAGYGIPEIKGVMDQLNLQFPGDPKSTQEALSASFGAPASARQVAASTYGMSGLNRDIGVNKDGQIDHFTGVQQRIQDVLSAVVAGRAQAKPADLLQESPAVALPAPRRIRAVRSAPSEQAVQPTPPPDAPASSPSRRIRVVRIKQPEAPASAQPTQEAAPAPTEATLPAPTPKQAAATSVAAAPQREAAPAAAPAPKPSTLDDDVAKALDVIKAERRVSTTLLQRRLKFGYNRAVRLIGELEARKIVGPAPKEGGLRKILLEGFEEAPAPKPQEAKPKVTNEVAVTVPAVGTQPVGQGNKEPEGAGRVDRPQEVRQGAVPADVGGGAQVEVAPLTARSKAIAMAEQEIESLRIDPNAKKSKAVALARKLFNSGLISKPSFDAAVRVSKGRGIGVDGVLGEIKFKAQPTKAKGPIATPTLKPRKAKESKPPQLSQEASSAADAAEAELLGMISDEQDPEAGEPSTLGASTEFERPSAPAAKPSRKADRVSYIAAMAKIASAYVAEAINKSQKFFAPYMKRAARMAVSNRKLRKYGVSDWIEAWNVAAANAGYAGAPKVGELVQIRPSGLNLAISPRNVQVFGVVQSYTEDGNALVTITDTSSAATRVIGYRSGETVQVPGDDIIDASKRYVPESEESAMESKERRSDATFNDDVARVSAAINDVVASVPIFNDLTELFGSFKPRSQMAKDEDLEGGEDDNEADLDVRDDEVAKQPEQKRLGVIAELDAERLADLTKAASSSDATRSDIAAWREEVSKYNPNTAWPVVSKAISPASRIAVETAFLLSDAQNAVYKSVSAKRGSGLIVDSTLDKYARRVWNWAHDALFTGNGVTWRPFPKQKALDGANVDALREAATRQTVSVDQEGALQLPDASSEAVGEGAEEVFSDLDALSLMAFLDEVGRFDSGESGRVRDASAFRMSGTRLIRQLIAERVRSIEKALGGMVGSLDFKLAIDAVIGELMPRISSLAVTGARTTRKLRGRYDLPVEVQGRIANKLSGLMHKRYLQHGADSITADTRLFSGPTSLLSSNKRLLSSGSYSIRDALGVVIAEMQPGSVPHRIATRLAALSEEGTVNVLSDADFDAAASASGTASNATAFYDIRTGDIYVRQSANAHDYLVMHEVVHALTVARIKSDPAFRRQMLELRREAAGMVQGDFYGLRDFGSDWVNAAEFVGEVLSNPRLQDALSTKPSPKRDSLWQRIKSFIATKLGLAPANADDVQSAIIDAVMDAALVTPEVAVAKQPAPDFSDAAYMSLAKRYEAGDESVLPELQRMVDEAAKRAGYAIGPVYHHGGFDAQENSVPDTSRGFHFGTKRAAEERAFGKPVDDFIQNAEVEFDGNIGAWFWSSDGVDSFDVVGDGGFASEAAARRNLEQFAQEQNFDQTPPEDLGSMTGAYLNLQNPLRVQDQKNDWVGAIQRALSGGNDSIEYINQFEDKGSTSYVALKPNQIKSADPITRDSSGNIIPLSQRFNPSEQSILYASPEFGKRSDVVRATSVPGLEAGQISRLETEAALKAGFVSKGVRDIINKATRVPAGYLVRRGETPENFETLSPARKGADASIEIARAEEKAQTRLKWIIDAGKIATPEDLTEDQEAAAELFGVEVDQGGLGPMSLTEYRAQAKADEEVSILDEASVMGAAFVQDIKDQLDGQRARLAKLFEEVEATRAEKLDKIRAGSRKADYIEAVISSERGGRLGSTFVDGMLEAFDEHVRRLGSIKAGLNDKIRRQADETAQKIQRIRSSTELYAALVKSVSKLMPASVIAEAVAADSQAPVVAWIASNRASLVADGVSPEVLATLLDGDEALLNRYTSLHKALAKLAQYKADAEKAKGDIEAFEKDWSEIWSNVRGLAYDEKLKTWVRKPGKDGKVKQTEPGSVTLRKWAGKYEKMVVARADALEGVRLLDADIRRQDSDILATIRTIDKLERILEDEGLQREYETAVDVTKASSQDARGTVDGTTITYRIGDRDFSVDQSGNKAKEAQSYPVILEAAGAARNALDPKSSTYEKDAFERRRLRLILMDLDRMSVDLSTSHVETGPADVISQIRNSFPLLQNMVTRSLIYRIIPGRLMTTLRGIGTVLDSTVTSITAANKNKAYGFGAQDIANARAIRSHPEMDALRWNREVASFIFAGNQSYQRYLLKVGDIIPQTGHRITREDMDAARLQRRWSDKIYEIMTRQNRKDLGIEMYYPVEVEDSRGVMRKPYAAGPMVVPRRFNRDKAKVASGWLELGGNTDAKLAQLAQPSVFRDMALGHVAEINSSEYKRFTLDADGRRIPSRLEGAYQKLAVMWATGKAALPKDIDDLFMQVHGAQEASDDKLDLGAVKAALIAELDAMAANVNRYANPQSEVDIRTGDVKSGERGLFDPAGIKVKVDPDGNFTKARRDMVGPSTFYDYSLASDVARGSLAAGALMQTRLVELRLMREVISALDEEINKMVEAKGDKRSISALRLQADMLSNAYSLLFDRVAASSDRRGSSSIEEFINATKTGLLAMPQSSVFNFVSASAMSSWAQRYYLMRHTGDVVGGKPGRLGRATAVGRAGAAAVFDIVAVLASRNKAMSRWLQGNRKSIIPGIAKLADLARRMQEADSLLRSYGIIPDEASLMQRARDVVELGTSKYSVPYSEQDVEPAAWDKVRQLFAKWMPAAVVVEVFRSAVPAGDRLANIVTLVNSQDALRRALGMMAVAVDRRVKAVGDKAATPGYWSNPENAITGDDVESMNVPRESLAIMKVEFAPLGGLDQLAYDYWRRMQEAKSKGAPVSDVAPIADPGITANILTTLMGLTNVSLDTNRPDVGNQNTVLGRTYNSIFTFMGWVNGFISFLTLANSVDPGRRGLPRLGVSVASVIILSAILAATGVPLLEVKRLLYGLGTGREYPVITAGNVVNDPSPATVARLLGAAFALQVPYAGEGIASLVGATQYRSSALDLTSLSLPLSMLGRTYEAISSGAKTGDYTGMLGQLSKALVPPTGIVVNRLMADRSAIPDAVRSAVAARGPLEARESGGKGAQPTEFSNLVRRAVAAEAGGNKADADRLIRKAVEVKSKDSSDPWGAVRSAVSASKPSMRAFGRKITEEEEAGLTARMRSSQRSAYQRGNEAVASLLGRVGGMAKASKAAATAGARPGGSGASRLIRGGAIAAASKRIRAMRSSMRPPAIRAMRRKLSQSRLRIPRIGASARSQPRPARLGPGLIASRQA